MLQEVDRLLTFDEMMEAIRQEVQRRRASERPGSVGEAVPAMSTGVAAEAPDWSSVKQNLGVAEQFAPLSSLPPQFVNWGPYRRAVALGVARGVMYLSRFITNKQTRFNESILAAVRLLTTHTQSSVERQLELVAVLNRHEAQTRELYTSMSQRLEALAARVASLEARGSRQARKRPGSSSGGSGK